MARRGIIRQIRVIEVIRRIAVDRSEDDSLEEENKSSHFLGHSIVRWHNETDVTPTRASGAI